MTRFIFCGSRSWVEVAPISNALVHLGDDDVVVHGGAKGADWITNEVATELGIAVEVHPADWEKHGNGAGIIRNAEMANLGAHECLAFWDGTSRGTANMIAAATQRGIPVRVFPLHQGRLPS